MSGIDGFQAHTNPYARNSILVSIGFILFYFLDIELTDPSAIHIFFNSLKINKPELIPMVSWVLLVWTIVSFNVHSMGEFLSQGYLYVSSKLNKIAYREEIMSLLKSKAKDEMNNPEYKKVELNNVIRGVSDANLNPVFGNISINNICEINASFSLKISSRSVHLSKDSIPLPVKIPAFMIIWPYLKFWLKYIFTQPNGYTHLVTHFLFCGAVVIGLFCENEDFFSICVKFPI